MLTSRHLRRHVSSRSLVDIKPVRDRGLDHAVEKEQNLIPLLSLKHLLKSSPSNSLPLSVIKSSLPTFPTRHVDFVRRYPAVFKEEEHISAADPHIKLTPQTLTLDEEEEQLVLNSETHLLESADRVLKLLMLAGSRKVPVPVIQRLRFDLGLPHDFTETLIPRFPDYFQVNHDEVELVCWNSDLAVSVMEKKAKGYEKGKPIEFPMKFSTGFEMENKFKKWVDEWQKLPYVSPYENAMHLSGKSDEGDKWVVSVLHEVLSLLYSKKTDRENLLFFGECLGLRTRIKQALLHHPGIFYISRKLGSHTVVLRDGYKRDLLVEKHQLMAMRYKYIHLMNMAIEDKKQKAELGDSGKEKKPILDTEGEEGEEKVDDEDGEVDEVSGSEVDESKDDYDDDDDDDDDEDENDNKELSHTNGRGNGGRTRESPRFEGKRDSRTSGGNSFDGSKRRRTRNYEDKDEDENEGRRFSRGNPRGNRGRTRENPRFEGKRVEFGRDGSNQRRPRKYETNNDDEDRKFSNNNSSGNRGRTRNNPRSEGDRVEFGRDGSNQRRPRKYETNNDDEDRKFSNNNSSGNRGRTRNNPRSEGDRVEFGRDGPKQRKTRNYEAKDEDDDRTYSHKYRGDKGRTRDYPRFEKKRDFKTSDESGRDGPFQRRTRKYEDEGRRRMWKREAGEDSKREGFNGKRNDRGKSKESRYKESSRSAMAASA